MTWQLVFLILAAICFLGAALNVEQVKQVKLLPLGLLFWVVTYLRW